MSVARVSRENKTNYLITDSGKEMIAVVRGKFHLSDQGFPKVGDYVEYAQTTDTEAVIEEVLPRRTEIVRKSAGETTERQVIVANVDLIYIVMGLDDDFNLKRLERYVLLAEQSGVKPVIVLNKCDIPSHPEQMLKEVQERFAHVDCHLVGAARGTNMDSIMSYVHDDVTAVLLGSSGAGKSTITNWLLRQDIQDTQEVRKDDGRGRHTTTARQLFSLPRGGYLIDTPGMRELGVVGEIGGEVFTNIEELSRLCKFRDCDHERSAGCAVQKAIAEGKLDYQQLASFQKLGREKAFLESRGDQEAEWKHNLANRKLHKKYSQIQREKYDRQ
ncbi:MAG TPA: ribosome small subunit-dependent GTPase A [Candidatus Paceibacterota bacterium]|nr:ribosome small subunit-dependent GTPase A [Candidatus Paceibacterota bacterium]